jgi:tripartite-type tricarboxylate transporter receptor subunit TctC
VKKIVGLVANAALAAGVLLSFAASAAAQAWPNRPMKLIVSYTAGGVTDQVARLMAQKLSDALGQSFVVENKPGATGAIGSEMVANSPPDGYTFLMYVDANAIMPAITKNMRYDAVKSFAPISLLGRGSHVIVAHPSLSMRSLGDMIAYAKENPGKLSYASPGFGSGHHLAMEMLKKSAGIDIVDISYKGGAQSISDMLGGQVNLGITGIAAVLPYIRSGKLVPLAVTSNKRSPLLPDVPTVAEAAALPPGFDVTQWQGMVAPAGTPAEIVSRLHDELLRIMSTPSVIERLAAMGVDNSTSPTPADFQRLIETDVARWPAIVKSIGVQSQ